ncbi:MAG: MBL fold metallo-hydrolase [Lachnospiraceae bacterium]|nr:MBL fold metallo-hydrolase [Lachnospiraceae bacterium]
MTGNITVFVQNSIRIEGSMGTVYIDPFQMKEAFHDADLILITHDHYDHFSPDDIRMVAGSNTTLVVPEKMAGKAKEVADAVSKTETVRPGESYEIGGLSMETVPAYNLLKPFHPKGAGWVGYILSVDGQRIYIAGDTDATREAKAVKCDIAMIPIGGTYTMDAKKAAEYVNELQPKVAIPVHFGHIVGKPSDGDVFAQNVKAPVEVAFKIQF